MATHIKAPTTIKAHGNIPKMLYEYVGRVNTGTSKVSIAKMVSPAGWAEPGQTPEFDEFTIVLSGVLRVTTRDGEFDVAAGEAVHTPAGEWVKYGTPAEGGAEYVAVCVPAFSPETVNRDGACGR